DAEEAALRQALDPRAPEHAHAPPRLLAGAAGRDRRHHAAQRGDVPAGSLLGGDDRREAAPRADHLARGVAHAADLERAVGDGDLLTHEADAGQRVRDLRPLVDPGPLLRERLLDLVAAPRRAARRADVVAVCQPQRGHHLRVVLVPRVLDLCAEPADVALV